MGPRSIGNGELQRTAVYGVCGAVGAQRNDKLTVGARQKIACADAQIILTCYYT